MERPLNPSVEDDSLNLRPYWDAIWLRRKPIALALAAVTVLSLLTAMVAFVRSPSERVGLLHFRLLFAGASENQYPNSTPFSPMEIVGSSVVDEVFRVNELGRFGSVQTFKEGLTVQQSSSGLDMLAYEYQARLADTRLTAVDRAAIEADYRTKRESLRDPSFVLTHRRTERFREMPDVLRSKVLSDILETWAQQAQLRKGVLKYDIAILTDNVVSRETIHDLDYLVAADRLRAQATRILRSLEQLMTIPGAQTVKAPGRDVTLREVQARLQDVLRFELEPLMGTIRGAGLTKNAPALSLYASNMVFQLELQKREAEARASAIESALGGYVSPGSIATGGPSARGAVEGGQGDLPVVPQLSESFLDRLQRMAVQSQEGEMEYRRRLTDEAIAEAKQAAAYDRELSYYRALASSLQRMTAGAGTSMAATVSEQLGQAFSTVEQATKDVSAIYQEISNQNLNPSARLYSVTMPFSDRTVSSFSWERFLVFYAGLVLVTLLVGIAAALIVHLLRRKGTVAL